MAPAHRAAEPSPSLEAQLSLVEPALDDPTAAWLEDAAASAERARRELLEAASEEGFLELDDQGRARASRALAVALGLDDADALSGRWGLDRMLSRVHPSHRRRFVEGLTTHRADPGGPPFEIEIAVAHREAGWRRLRCRMASRKGPDNQAQRTVLAFLDVTRLRRAEERAAAAEARAEALEAELARLRADRAPRGPRPKRALKTEQRTPAAEVMRMAALRAVVERALAALDELPTQVEGPASWPVSEARRSLAAVEDAARDAAEPLREGFCELVRLTEDLALTALNAQLEALRLRAERATAPSARFEQVGAALDAGSSGLVAAAACLKGLARETGDAFRSLAARLRQREEAVDRIAQATQRTAGLLDAVQAEIDRLDRARRAMDLLPLRACLAEARRLARVVEDDPPALPDPPLEPRER